MYLLIPCLQPVTGRHSPAAAGACACARAVPHEANFARWSDATTTIANVPTCCCLRPTTLECGECFWDLLPSSSCLELPYSLTDPHYLCYELKSMALPSRTVPPPAATCWPAPPFLRFRVRARQRAAVSSHVIVVAVSVVIAIAEESAGGGCQDGAARSSPAATHEARLFPNCQPAVLADAAEAAEAVGEAEDDAVLASIPTAGPTIDHRSCSRVGIDHGPTCPKCSV